MSMQHRLPEQVVRPDPWTLFCAECSKKGGYTSPGGKGIAFR